MPGSILGNAVRRVEDPELLVGDGTFIDNLRVDGMLHLAFVRSPFAHARVRRVDTAEAAVQPGVVAVLTAVDLDVPAFHTFGSALNDNCARPPLATERVRFAGEAVAVVAAETKAAAVDAAELVVVDYDPLPAVADMEAALDQNAPTQFDEVPRNLAASTRAGNDRDPLADADVVVRARIENQRVAVVPMEGNAIAVVPGEDFTIYVSTQMPHLFARLAGRLFGFSRDRLRVIAPHVGGAFGSKAGMAAEHAVAIAVARLLERPVKWVETRSENMTAMLHGRGQVQYVELGLRRDGTFTGLRCRVVGDAGAYAGFGGGLPLGSTKAMAQGVYRIPKISYDCAVALTNTTPMGAFRGAGRPEAAAMLERIVDIAADELGLDPVAIRKRNLLQPEQFPYTTVMGTRYDVGDYDKALDEATRVAGYDTLRTEQRSRINRGDTTLLGIGVSAYVEVTGGGAGEFASVAVDDDGGATIRVGTSAHGQGHATSFAMIVADRLGIPIERIRFVQSDTREVPRGGGTGGSRSLQIGGSAVRQASDAVLDRARRLAAELLEADPADIVVTDDGGLGVAGVPASSRSWEELARAAAGEGEPLAVALDFDQEHATFPFGAHVAVVEVDVETGRTRLVRHIAVDDCGRVLNPLIVEGQQHGGIAQGAAQALWEQVVYDGDANPMTTTLADYGMPTAAELPSFETSNTETPTPLNPLGAKGIGESGTIGSTPAVQNAVVDALSHLGVRHIDMPCTPERVWQAVRDAKAGTLPDPWRDPPDIFATLPDPDADPEAASIEI